MMQLTNNTGGERTMRMPRIAVFSRFDSDDPEHSKISVSVNYTKAILTAGGLPMILPSTQNPDVLQSIVASFDGFLIPGGHDVDPFYYGQRRSQNAGATAPERDMMELAIVPLIVQANKPLLGICRGNQVLNVSMGGSLYQDIQAHNPEALDHVQTTPYYEMAHGVRIQEGSKLHSAMGATNIVTNSIHHQAIDALGDGLVANSWAEDGTIEGIELPSKRFVVGVQWHPEYLWRTDHSEMNLFKAFVDACRETSELA